MSEKKKNFHRKIAPKNKDFYYRWWYNYSLRRLRLDILSRIQIFHHKIYGLLSSIFFFAFCLNLISRVGLLSRVLISRWRINNNNNNKNRQSCFHRFFIRRLFSRHRFAHKMEKGFFGGCCSQTSRKIRRELASIWDKLIIREHNT